MLAEVGWAVIVPSDPSFQHEVSLLVDVTLGPRSVEFGTEVRLTVARINVRALDDVSQTDAIDDRTVAGVKGDGWLRDRARWGRRYGGDDVRGSMTEQRTAFENLKGRTRGNQRSVPDGAGTGRQVGISEVKHEWHSVSCEEATLRPFKRITRHESRLPVERKASAAALFLSSLPILTPKSRGFSRFPTPGDRGDTTPRGS